MYIITFCIFVQHHILRRGDQTNHTFKGLENPEIYENEKNQNSAS